MRLIDEIKKDLIFGIPNSRIGNAVYIDNESVTLLIELAELDLKLEKMSIFSSRAKPLEKRHKAILDQLEAEE